MCATLVETTYNITYLSSTRNICGKTRAPTSSASLPNGGARGTQTKPAAARCMWHDIKTWSRRNKARSTFQPNCFGTLTEKVWGWTLECIWAWNETGIPLHRVRSSTYRAYPKPVTASRPNGACTSQLILFFVREDRAGLKPETSASKEARTLHSSKCKPRHRNTVTF